MSPQKRQIYRKEMPEVRRQRIPTTQRPSLGRPPLEEEERYEYTITVALTASQLAELEETAWQVRKKRTVLFRELALEGLKKLSERENA